MDVEVLEAAIDAANDVLGSMWVDPPTMRAGLRDELTSQVAAMVSMRTDIGFNEAELCVREIGYPVTLVLGGTNDQDIAEDWLVESAAEWLDGSRTIRWQRPGKLEETALDALCVSQGTCLEAAVNAQEDGFSRSLAEELRDAYWAPGSRLCALVSMDWKTLLDCTMSSCYPSLAQQVARPLLTIEADESPVVGLFDPATGDCSRMGIRIRKPIEVSPATIEAAMVERASGEATWGEELGCRWLTPGDILGGRVADLFGARARRRDDEAAFETIRR